MRIAGFFFAVLALSLELSAASIRVPQEQPTIQAGINAAVNEDTVLVAAGIYVGDGNRDLDFGGRLIVLKSESGPQLTIIDCQADSSNKHNAFYFRSGEDSTAVLDGFTIMHAFADERGAVNCELSAPTVRNCIITENLRGGINLYNGFGMVLDSCVITRNAGDGVEFSFCRVWVSECSVDSNEMGGISAYNNTALSLTNSQMVGNGAIGLVHVAFTSQAYVTNCIFIGNRVGFCLDGDFPKNHSLGFFSFDATTVTNSIFAFNTDYGFEIGSFAWEFNAYCNDWYGNANGNFRLLATGSPFDTSGNISANPLFCGTTGKEYTIAAQSPCAPTGNSCGVLMGRYQPGCTDAPIRGDANGDGSVNISDAVYLINYIILGGPAPNPFSSGDADCSGAISISDVVYLINYVFAGGPSPCEG